MKNNSKHTDESVPQTVTGFIKLSTGSEAIQIGFTDQRDLDLIREDVRFTLPPELATIAAAPRR